jgi:DNA-binding MarR family transcriptional regulator
MKLSKAHLDLEHRTSYRFAVLSAASTRSVAGLYRRHGLTIGGWRTLSLIGHHEPINPGAIAERTSVDQDKVTRAVDRLVARGYVTRRVDGADRRRVILRLTPRGRRVYAEIENVRRAIEQKFMGALPPAERARFLASLAKLEAQARRLFSREYPWCS